MSELGNVEAAMATEWFDRLSSPVNPSQRLTGSSRACLRCCRCAFLTSALHGSHDRLAAATATIMNGYRIFRLQCPWPYVTKARKPQATAKTPAFTSVFFFNTIDGRCADTLSSTAIFRRGVAHNDGYSLSLGAGASAISRTFFWTATAANKLITKAMAYSPFSLATIFAFHKPTVSNVRQRITENQHRP